MSPDAARSFLVTQLSPTYGEAEAKAIARIVFEDAFDRGRSFESSLFDAILERLLQGEPVQYVLGEADFFGLKFKVGPAVLIPRQETEELVAWILAHLKTLSPVSSPTLLDIGLGSGCIGITLKQKRPAIQLYGLEKSPEALAMATLNATRLLSPSKGNSEAFSFRLGDILNPSDWIHLPAFNVIVSNPPYIPPGEKHLMPTHVLAFEPEMALFVEDADPLLFYRVIADFAMQKLQQDGALFFECNEFNASQVLELLREKGFVDLELRKDLSGAERMIKGTL